MTKVMSVTGNLVGLSRNSPLGNLQIASLASFDQTFAKVWMSVTGNLVGLSHNSIGLRRRAYLDFFCSSFCKSLDDGDVSYWESSWVKP